MRHRWTRRTFNRTSLELKRVDTLVRMLERQVTFNRTSLELKHTLPQRAYPQAEELLIAPVWN